MLFNSITGADLLFSLGEIALLLVIGILLFALALAAIVLWSVKTGHIHFPRLLRACFPLMEGLIKGLCRLFGLEDEDLIRFTIKLHNGMSRKGFSEIPVSERIVFLPQCLRSAECPAHLSPEGLQCKNCGLCQIGKYSNELKNIGYKVYIVPGSTFLKRIVQKMRPRAIIGVGCLVEVKDGLDLADKMGLSVMGVIILKDGCVETVMNWDDLLMVAGYGLDPTDLP